MYKSKCPVGLDTMKIFSTFVLKTILILLSGLKKYPVVMEQFFLSCKWYKPPKRHPLDLLEAPESHAVRLVQVLYHPFPAILTKNLSPVLLYNTTYYDIKRKYLCTEYIYYTRKNSQICTHNHYRIFLDKPQRYMYVDESMFGSHHSTETLRLKHL